MTVPDELVQAVHDATMPAAHTDDGCPWCEAVLAAVPNGWAKIDGEWVRVSPFAQRLILGNVTDVGQEQ